MPKLAIQQVRIFRVDWLTYAHEIGKGRCGMGQHLANMVGRKEEIQLLESPNDTVYKADARLEKFDLGPLWIKERQDIVDRLKSDGHIECWALRPLLLAAVERDWIPAGQYLVAVSW